jgi:hypothetical protein
LQTVTLSSSSGLGAQEQQEGGRWRPWWLQSPAPRPSRSSTELGNRERRSRGSRRRAHHGRRPTGGGRISVGRPAVGHWRRPVSKHGRRSGASQSTGGGGGGPTRPRKVAGVGGFSGGTPQPAESRTAGGGPAAPAAHGWAKGEARCARLKSGCRRRLGRD